MGTRSITVVKDINNKKIIEMYKQYDGYPDGIGQELIEFINSGKMTNGIRVGEDEKVFNGIECFAAQLVSHFKNGAGGVYLYAPTMDYKDKKKYSELYGAEYYYEINRNLKLECWDTYTGEKLVSLEK